MTQIQKVGISFLICTKKVRSDLILSNFDHKWDLVQFLVPSGGLKIGNQIFGKLGQKLAKTLRKAVPGFWIGGPFLLKPGTKTGTKMLLQSDIQMGQFLPSLPKYLLKEIYNLLFQ